MNRTAASPRLNSPFSADASTIHRQTVIARWAAFGILAWMFVPLITGRIYVCDDLLNYHLPVRQFYAECLKNGDAYDWMPGLFSGFYLTGSGQAGTYHPWHWLLYRFLPLPTAFNLEILSSYPFMLFGMKFFLQRHLRRLDAAWLGAITFTFSGFCMLHFLHPNAVAVVSHIPWLLLAHDMLLRPEAPDSRRRIAAEAGIPILTGSQLLLGYPQYVWFSLLAEGVYCLAFAARTWKGVRILTLIAILKILGLTLGAVQILPSLAALSESDRNAMPAEFFFQHPLTPPDMLQWVAPFLTKSRVFGANTHELGLYCGALPLLLAVVAVWKIRGGSGPARLIRTMIVLGLISLWLSFGKSGGLYIVQTWLPLIGKFRWPSRIIVLLHFVVAVLAAAGYARLTAPQIDRSLQLPRILFLAPLLSVFASIFVCFVSGRITAAPLSLLAIGPILFFLAVLMLRDAARGKISAGFILFLSGDIAAYGLTYEALSKTQTMEQILSGLAVPPGKPEDGRLISETRISNGPVTFGGNELLLAGWRQADGYEGMLPPIRLLDENISLDGLRISGVRYIVNQGQHSAIAGVRPTSDARWLEVPDPLPRVRLTNHVRRVENPEEAVRAVSASGPVVVNEDLLFESPEEHRPSGILAVRERPGFIEIHTETRSAELLVLAERFSPGWKATVDNSPAGVVRADVDFMGCVVPEGTHSTRFSFEPANLKTGRRVSALTLAVLILCAAVRTGTWRRHRASHR